jgi:diguanylate cyclase
MTDTEQIGRGPIFGGRDGLKVRILQDQLSDIRSGVFFSIPISTMLSVLILAVHMASVGSIYALFWFAAVNLINATRIVLAIVLPKADGAGESDLRQVTVHLRYFKLLALLSGIAWAFLALLADGFTTPESPLYLIILAGISAGAVVYGSSCASVAINFITPPLLVAAACVLPQGGIENQALTFSILLFLGGLARGTFVGQARFIEASRLKHEAKQIAAEMERSSWEDPLTGLLNRRGLENAIDRIAHADGPFVTMLIDLDGFKSVNDTYGHKVGDDLLVRIARRIEEQAPARSILARIGGDEFVLLYPTAAARNPPDKLASEAIAAIARPYPGVASVRIGACVGIYGSDKPSLTEMLLRADVALYAAKRRGRNEFCLFDAALQEQLERRQCIERDLRSAIETKSLGTWFQPIVRLETGGIIGFEALLRWYHPVHGEIAPPEIVDAARETGLLQQLTETVFLNCCCMIESLMRAGLDGVRVAMNLSPRELENGSVDDMIVAGLDGRGLPASMLEVEITEEAPIDRQRVSEKLERLSDFGISIALDDFGTGFSTLAALRDSRIRKVKIDKGFIGGIAGSPDDQLLVKAVIDLCGALGIEVLAEGVETGEDCETLRMLGCTTAQGFLFSKAVPLEQAIELASRRSGGTHREMPAADSA